ncbi:MAG: CARDB domain-containing protein [bacterium]
MNTETQIHNRQAAIRALAVVGFIALLFIGMTLAVYTARYIPAAISGIGQAAVSLSSVFVPAKESTLEVVNSGTVVPFGTPAASTTTVNTTVVIPATTTTTSSVTATVAPTPSAGAPANNAYVIPGTGTAVRSGSFTGLPDLTVTNLVVGYLPSNDSSDAAFVLSSSVPDNRRFAVKFSVVNRGTNVSGTWDFEAKLPTKQSYTFSSPTQVSLNPGDHIDFMLHLDDGEAKTGDQSFSVTLDPDKDVSESDESNNYASASIEIRD